MHHLIDPRTGEPSGSDVVQSTVLAGSAAEADAWAKALLILGAAGAQEVLHRRPDLRAIVIPATGPALATPGLAAGPAADG